MRFGLAFGLMGGKIGFSNADLHCRHVMYHAISRRYSTDSDPARWHEYLDMSLSHTVICSVLSFPLFSATNAAAGGFGSHPLSCQ